jgi:hypothetical protein
MKLPKKPIIALLAASFIALLTFIVYFARSPVLVVTDESFVLIYGQDRIRSETKAASFSLFRRLKTVLIADEAGMDIVPVAVSEVSSRPYCVLFPLRFAHAARVYREQNPEIPVVLLEGRYSDGENALISSAGINVNDYFIYKTDFDDEFTKAALVSTAIDNEKNGKIVVFMEQYIQIQARTVFLQTLGSINTPLDTRFFTSFSQFSEISDISCVVLAGEGSEYFEDNSGVPVVFFTWNNPLFMPIDVVLVVNDSPWVQAVQAVRMVSAGQKQGKIRSKFIVLKRENIDTELLHKIVK